MRECLGGQTLRTEARMKVFRNLRDQDHHVHLESQIVNIE